VGAWLLHFITPEYGGWMPAPLKHSWIFVCAVLMTACGEGADFETVSEEPEELVLVEKNLKGETFRRVESQGRWTVFENAYGDGTANPAANIEGRVRSYAVTDRLTLVTVTVENLEPNRQFGAHVHKLPCTDTKGGGHYQHVPAPTTPTDPAYANPRNEVWLDFETNRHGRGFAWALVHWTFREDGANSVVVHHTKTAVDGTAGARLACRNVAF
jgi:superoxide dismutase, Cu-Zn family